MSLKKNMMMINNNYYLTVNNQSNRNISAEVKDKQNLFLEQYKNNYTTFQKQLSNANVYPNNNTNYLV